MNMTTTAAGKSTPAAKSPDADRKPKRPLSGYNLFYRYKRCCVLEAHAGDRRFASPVEEKAAVESVLSALPGLEGIPPDNPVWRLPQDAIDEIRVDNIRAAMEGRLFPNENARKRLHRKVHGMGFVEMGRVMRDLWARVDIVAKDVFCELAHVGRVRYRVLLGEWESRRRFGGKKGRGAAPVSRSVARPAKDKRAMPAKCKNTAATSAKFAAPARPAAMMVAPAVSEKPSVPGLLTGSRRASPPKKPFLGGGQGHSLKRNVGRGINPLNVRPIQTEASLEAQHAVLSNGNASRDAPSPSTVLRTPSRAPYNNASPLDSSREEGLSMQDFLDLMGTLDDAIDDAIDEATDRSDEGAAQGDFEPENYRINAEPRPSSISGRPVHGISRDTTGTKPPASNDPVAFAIFEKPASDPAPMNIIGGLGPVLGCTPINARAARTA